MYAVLLSGVLWIGVNMAISVDSVDLTITNDSNVVYTKEYSTPELAEAALAAVIAELETGTNYLDLDTLLA